VGRTDAWQKELQRNFWRENFKTGAAFDRFLSEQESAFRRVWAEIGSPS
jgi:tripartite-type tricarboxylate transporter receptor subunit TctC